MKDVIRLMTFLAVVIPARCFAFTAPGSGDTGYQIYDFVTSNIMDGAIGITICICILAYGAFFVLRSNIFGAIGCCVAAILFYSAEDMALAIGYTFM